jgi:hypothetical protein
MNRNGCDLLLWSVWRSNGLKSGTYGFCFAHRFDLETARSAGSKAPDPRIEPFTETVWQGLSVRASVIPSQTDSLESTVFCYFPL